MLFANKIAQMNIYSAAKHLFTQAQRDVDEQKERGRDR